MMSLHQRDLTRPPGLVEPRLQWSVHAKDHKPALARNRLQPVVLFACRRFWREIDVERAIRVLLYSLSLASDCREALAGLQHRARLRVVHRDRPEVVYRHIGRQMEFVGFGAIEWLFLAIKIGSRVIGTYSYSRFRHGRRHTASIEVIQYSRVKLHCSVRLERGVPVREERRPYTVGAGIEIHSIHPWIEGDGARGRTSDCGGFGQQLFHSFIGRERLAFDDADSGDGATLRGINRIDGLVLNDLI